MVDEFLKRAEPKSLRYTRISVKEVGGSTNVYIKIYLESPIRLNTLNELVRNLSVKYGVSMESFAIYPPHARAIRVSFSMAKK